MKREPPIHHVACHLLQMDGLFTAVAEHFGTPLYVYDLPTFLAGWDAARAIVPEGGILYYSVKANPNCSLLLALHEIGAHFEVASEGELETVLAVGIDPQQLLFVGPGKTPSALKKAIDVGVGIIVAESSTEFSRICEYASSAVQSPVCVALRINPGKGAGRVAMGGVTAFGMSPVDALALIRGEHPSVDIVGLHSYLGTGLLDWQDIIEHTRMILDTARDLQQRSGHTFRFVDVGGGLGIPYFTNDQALQTLPLREQLLDLFTAYAHEHPGATLAMESGRYIAGPAGVFLARVLDVKDVADQCFVVLDGGTNVMGLADRYLGQRALPFRILDADKNWKSTSITLVGPLCTPTDRLAVEQWVPRPMPGALVAFYQVGAYGLTASPGLFLGHGFPVEVLLDGGRMKLIRERFAPRQILLDQPVNTPWEIL